MNRKPNLKATESKLIAILIICLVSTLMVLAGAAGVAQAQTVIKTIPVGAGPWDVTLNPVTNKIYVANGTSSNVTVIDGATDTVKTTIPLSTTPDDLGVNTVTDKVYVGSSSSNTISVIDGVTDAVVGAPITLANSPSIVEINPVTNKIYVGYYTTQQLTVISGETNAVVGTIMIGGNTQDIGVNTVTNKVYVAMPGTTDNVAVINGATDTLIGKVTAGDSPGAVGVNEATNKIYIGNYNGGNVSVINGVTDTIIGGLIPAGTNPYAAAVNQTTNMVYLTNPGSNNVTVVNGTSDTATATVAVGTAPTGIGANANTNKVYVANYGLNNVYVIYDPPANIAHWYLAEGTTAWGFSTYITIENPNNQQCTAAITYNTSSGAIQAPDVSLPPMSQTTVNPETVVPNQDFSTMVTCKEGNTIAVDRTMIWTGPGAPSPEAHSSVGVTSPSKVWYLPEGSSEWGFECWLLIQNPNNQDTTAKVTYMIENEGPKTVEHPVPANSRRTFNMFDDIGKKDASIMVAADLPVIPERAMYRNNRREGHDSIGTTAAAKDYYLAEGTTAWGFTTYVLVQNPQTTSTDVTITYMTPEGPMTQAPFTMQPGTRKTVRVNDIPGVSNTDLSTQVHGSQQIIAERAMYWGAGTPLGEACHDSIGMASPHTNFYLPDGESKIGAGVTETWTLVQNPNDTDVTVQISYLTPTGQGNVSWPETIKAKSRKTFNMAEKLDGRGAVMVSSTTAGKKIMVERAMYWFGRGAGTDTIGGYTD